MGIAEYRYWLNKHEDLHNRRSKVESDLNAIIEEESVIAMALDAEQAVLDQKRLNLLTPVQQRAQSLQHQILSILQEERSCESRMREIQNSPDISVAEEAKLRDEFEDIGEFDSRFLAKKRLLYRVFRDNKQLTLKRIVRVLEGRAA